MPRRYRNVVCDSSRWDDFEFRAGDIVISTPPKCGTTWTQMICALLVLQDTVLPAPLATLSPWLDMTTTARKVVFATLGAQRHRRFIKSHLPLDGLPVRDDVTYVCAGRDPRDVALSMDHHVDNLDVAELLRSRAAAAEIDGVELEPPQAPPDRPIGELDRFWNWMESETPVTETVSTLRFTIHHLHTFWDADALDVVLLHYDDLRVDLEAEMRGLADRLRITVPAARWPKLVEAASFEEMRRRATTTVPGASLVQWRDPAAFFRNGTSGQWRALLDAGDQSRYAQLVTSLAPADLAAWLHRPPLTQTEALPL
jgi:hypothetical protein